MITFKVKDAGQKKMITTDRIMLWASVEAAVFFWGMYLLSQLFSKNDPSGLSAVVGFFAGLIFAPVIFGGTVLAGFIVKEIQKEHDMPNGWVGLFLLSPVLIFVGYVVAVNIMAAASS